ncbi:MAG TPA: thiamine phosphate synthase [Solirubrobacteraceae bacterium]
MSDRHQRLRGARLYLVCDEQSDEFLERALSGGVDIVQLRIKQGADDDRLVAVARRYACATARHRALLILNDRPDLVAAAGADGVHVGQDDVPVSEARAAVGSDRLVGLSTHTPEQIEAANRSGADVDYIGVGPVHTTPTKPGRAAVGLELVRYAAANAAMPFFAIGGIDATCVDAVRDAGGLRVAVVRALTQSEDPERAARTLCESLKEVPVGAA